MMKNPIATIELSNGGRIVMELFPTFAPNTVASFIWLANQGAFDQRSINRIVPGFVIQPSYTGFDKDPVCDYMIEAETRFNGHENPLTLAPFTVAMGGDGETLASGSCFFFVMGEHYERLDGKYPGFAKVVEGEALLSEMEQLPMKAVATDLPGVSVNVPETPILMEKVWVETFGQAYPEPEKTKGVWSYERNALVYGGLYQHFKGGLYRLLYLAKDSETMEEVVVYQDANEVGKVWVRPLAMFVEQVWHEGQLVKRFRFTEGQ